MTKKSKGLIITLIVLLSLIAISLVGIMAFVITGNVRDIAELKVMPKASVYFDESYNVSDVTDIQISSDVGDITVKNSSDGQIRLIANGNNQEYFTADLNDGMLTVDSKTAQSAKSKTVRNLGGADLELYIPEKLTSLDISNAFGDVDILSTVEMELQVQVDCGNIKADYLIGSFNFHSDLGDVEIGRADITSDSSATTSLGDVEIEKTSDVNIIANTSLGECKIRNSNSQSPITLKAESDLGDVEIN